MWTATSQPENDQVEVSVLGPGFGEAILIHLGQGRWATIDSCVDSEGNCVPLNYLKSIGVEPDQIDFVIATHWHHDHIRGLAKLLAWTSKAQFWCPTAFGSAEFFEFASVYGDDDVSRLGAPCSDIAAVFAVLEERGIKPRYAHQDTIIHSSSSSKVQIIALSPVQSRIHQFLQRIATFIPKLRQPRLRVPEIHPNLISLVIRVMIDDDAILLGADLQEQPNNGWSELLNTSQCLSGPKASLFKVPHHGSHNAHLARQWTDLLGPDPTSILTPYNRGSQKLPTNDDIARITSLSSKAFSAARPNSLAAQRFDRSVERSLSEGNIRLRSSEIKLGHVQLRKTIGGGADWTVKMFGNAVALNQASHNVEETAKAAR